MKYEVQEYCLCSGWTNTWSTEVNGIMEATWFSSREDAESELRCWFDDMQDEVEAGNMEDVPDREEFRIVEVA